MISDHHQPSIKAVQEVLPEATHVRTGLHRARGETTKPIERRHAFTRDRLRASRGLKTLGTGQRFCEGFAGLHALRRGHPRLAELVPGYDATRASAHDQVRAVAQAVTALGARLTKAAAPRRDRPSRAGGPAARPARLTTSPCSCRPVDRSTH